MPSHTKNEELSFLQFIKLGTPFLAFNQVLSLTFLFKIFKKDETKDDDKKIDEDKKIFNLKTFIQKLRKKKKDDTKD